MRLEDSDLLAKLHQSWAQTPPWKGFLLGLSQRIAANAAILRLVPPETDVGVTFAYGADQPMPLGDDALARMRYLRVYSNEDFPSPVQFRALRTKLDGGGEAWLLVQRAGGDFSAIASVILTGLAAHISVAAPQFFAAQNAQVYAREMDRLMAQQRLGWVVLAPSGAVIAASAGMAQRLIHDGRLRLPPHGARRVADALQAARAHPTAWEEADLQYLMTFTDQKIAVLYIQARTIPAPHPQAAAVLADMLGLAPSEARFALQLVGGRSIAQAGEALTLSLETARHYSKQIYSKLGLTSQTSVVQRIQNSVYRLL